MLVGNTIHEGVEVPVGFIKLFMDLVMGIFITVDLASTSSPMWHKKLGSTPRRWAHMKTSMEGQPGYPGAQLDTTGQEIKPHMVHQACTPVHTRPMPTWDTLHSSA